MIRISGVTSDDYSFDLTRVEPFEDLADAVEYARGYAKSVTGTDTVSVKSDGGTYIITALGESYSEELRVFEA